MLSQAILTSPSRPLAPSAGQGPASRTAALVLPAPTVTPEHSNQAVWDLFERNPQLVSLPVTESERPIGLINRHIFMQSLAKPFHREVYLRKSCIAFMDKAPLVVEQSTSIEELSFRAVDAGGKTLVDGFIITHEGLYVGVGTAQDMVRAVAHLQAEKNRQVMESITYGSVIQKSLARASREAMRATLPDHFLLWEPRDVVSGDYFFFQAGESLDEADPATGPQGDFFAALFDCTGHGVPGAFMTLIMTSFLQSALTPETRRDPSRVLGLVNRRVKTALGQVERAPAALPEAEEAWSDDEEHRSDDGMDAAFLSYDAHTRQLTFAGAHMALFLLPPGDNRIMVVEGNRAGVGYATTAMDAHWENHVLSLEPGTAVYAFSDGYLDQLGGDKRLAFGKRRLFATLLDLAGQPMPAQRTALEEALRAYQGSENRRDDVSALGIRF